MSEQTVTTDPKVIVALDFPAADMALDFVKQRLDPTICRVKVGKELFTSAGPDLVRELTVLGYDVFLDLKFHDIPNTVAGAIKSAAQLGIWMVNVHASGGRAMLQAAREAADSVAKPPMVIAVTVLTSLGSADMVDLGWAGEPIDNVLRLAQLTKDAGLEGVVCSAAEAKRLRQDFANEFCLVTPGVRLAGSARGDQVRVTTPTQAMADGASYLVMGRPITQADDPRSVLLTINSEICRYAS
jgi:orotidine-5'-phosphate decarboxylase